MCSANCQPNAAGASLKLGHHRHPQRRNAGLLALALSLGLALAVLSGQVAAPRLVSWLGRTAAAGGHVQPGPQRPGRTGSQRGNRAPPPRLASPSLPAAARLKKKPTKPSTGGAVIRISDHAGRA